MRATIRGNDMIAGFSPVPGGCRWSTTGQRPQHAFAAPSGDIDLGECDSAAMPIGPHSKSAAKAALIELSDRLVGLQARLLAQGRSGNPRRVLLILQGMDTCGKDGVIKHVLGGLNPVGVRVASFGGRPARNWRTISCGGSNGRFRPPALSVRSTARTTRTFWSRGCTATFRPTVWAPPV